LIFCERDLINSSFLRVCLLSKMTNQVQSMPSAANENQIIHPGGNSVGVGQSEEHEGQAGDIEVEDDNEVELASIKYYIEQLYNIMQPVMLCIILSVVWVKLSNPPPLFFDTGIV
jgi:hypothetical protein